MVHIEAFHAPCCGGMGGQRDEIRLATLMREVRRQLGNEVDITIHGLAFGDQESLEALSRLAGYLRASGMTPLADRGAFGMLGALPIITLNGIVRFVKTIPGQPELLAAIETELAAGSETRP